MICSQVYKQDEPCARDEKRVAPLPLNNLFATLGHPIARDTMTIITEYKVFTSDLNSA